MKLLSCKNCGHKIRIYPDEKMADHEYYSEVVSPHFILGKKCKCGCDNPEPKGDWK